MKNIPQSEAISMKFTPEFEEGLRLETEFLKKYFQERMGRQVLDMGCGSGRVIPVLAPLVERYLGFDKDPMMIEQAKKVKQSYVNVTVRHMDLFDPRCYGSGDVVLTTFNTLGCFEDPAKALSLMEKHAEDKVLAIISPKGVLDIRKKFYEKLQIPYTIDPGTEATTSETWGTVQVFTDEQLEHMAKEARLRISMKEKLCDLFTAVEFDTRNI